MPLLLVVFALLAAEGGSEGAEDSGRGAPQPRDSVRTSPDTLDLDAAYTFGGEWQPDPTGALLRSAVLPGWGQFYNRKPLKGLALGSVELGLLAWLIAEHAMAEEARDDFQRTGDPFYEDSYDRHSARRLDLIWYTSAAWLYGMLDAYVDAHLYGFSRENRDFERETGGSESRVIGGMVYIRF